MTSTTALDPQEARCPNCGCMALTQFHAGDSTAKLDKCPHWVPGRGWVASADLTAADLAEIEAWTPPALRYDEGYDNCAGGCARSDDRRVAFTYYGEPAFACPGCYEAIFGGPPDEDGLIVTAATTEGELTT